MAKVEKVDKNKIKIYGKIITLDEYNRQKSNPTLYPVLKEFKELGGTGGYFWSRKKPGTDEFYSSDEYVKEMAKNKNINLNLWSKIKLGLDNGSLADSSNWKIDPLFEKDKEKEMQKVVDKNEKWIQENLSWFTQMVNDMNQLKSQLEATGNDFGNDYNDPNKDKSREELVQRANEIEAHRKKAKGEIETALNQDPEITSEELEPGNQNWQEQIWQTIIALGEKEIDKIKERILADIETKRNVKKDKRKREDEGNDTPNEQPDPKKTKSDYDTLKNKTLGEITNNEAATVLKESTKLEGEQGYNQDEKIESMEDKLIADDPELYRQTIIEALKERMKDLNVKKEDLDEDTKKLIEGKITDAHQVKVVKNQAVKKIGELGAKNKWTSLFSKAQALLAKAKKNVTEQIKKDIKTVQEQIKNLKLGTNSYLSSYYQNEKNKVEKLERDLSNYSTTNQTNSPTPLKVIIPVSLAVVAVIGVATILIVKKRKQIKLKK